MSTRGAYGFRVGGVDKVSYNHSDSYPAGLGVDIVAFIKENSDKVLLKIAKGIELVKSNIAPTQKQMSKCKEFADLSVGKGKITDWYCLLRNAQGNLNAHKKTPYMIDGSSFLADSLFCEWAYIINLDTMKLEVYKGFNTDSKEAGRYASSIDSYMKEKKEGDDKYYGVALVDEIPLDKVRKLKNPLRKVLEKDNA